jgi:hypothetical protein
MRFTTSKRDTKPDRDRFRRASRRRGTRSDATGILSGALHYVTDAGRPARQQLRQTIGQTAAGVIDAVLDSAERLYEQQRDDTVSRVSSVSKMAARSAHALQVVKASAAAGYIEQAAHRVESATDYLSDRSLAEILEDAGEIVRRNPGAAMGGLFLAGFAMTRFLKSSETRRAR